ncbi:hypothetical protein [Pseudoalteromonas sp. S3173]|uniref:hypothetical protein n=1 Tax=Pseudoalteromonas sp. S3173 TaxID=579531 RepID=UPI00110CEBF5|nr:hypothetical protein [Pseudoalteromonas sp. S3173]TMS62703.1 hypothetical protein CWC10_05185 [Pseudoalteromonas sp. S3173]
MGLVNFIHVTNNNPIPVSFIDVDCDPSAERLMIISRESGLLISHKRIFEGRFTAFLEKKYALSNELMCVMLDDNGEFNAAIADNVQAMLINLIDFDPNNPQTYEPIP